MSFWKKLSGQSRGAEGEPKPSYSPSVKATPSAQQLTVICRQCRTSCGMPKTTPPIGTVLACSNCHRPLLLPAYSDAGGVPEKEVESFLGYRCSLGNPRCPSCCKTNYEVVFPDKGYNVAWYHNAKPENPNGFFIDIKCVHCGTLFVVEWDEFPFNDKSCNYCSAIGIGIDFMSILESQRQDFELDYGCSPQLPSPIKRGNGEALWLICPPCLTSANQGGYRKLLSAAKAFADDQLACGQTLPATVPLQQLVADGYIASNHVRGFQGLDVTIPLRDDNTHPHGPCIRVQWSDGSAYALLADGSIRDWVEYSRTINMVIAADKGSGKTPGESEFDSLVVELIKIGKEIEDPSYSSSGFLRKRATVEEIDHPRAREIGRRLYDMGNRKTELMLKAHSIVEQALGGRAASNLSCCWHRIGEDDWRAGRGECWMH